MEYSYQEYFALYTNASIRSFCIFSHFSLLRVTHLVSTKFVPCASKDEKIYQKYQDQVCVYDARSDASIGFEWLYEEVEFFFQFF